MLGLLVAAVADVGHDDAASLEFPPHAGVDTLGAPPVVLQGHWPVSVRRLPLALTSCGFAAVHQLADLLGCWLIRLVRTDSLCCCSAAVQLAADSSWWSAGLLGSPPRSVPALEPAFVLRARTGTVFFLSH